MKKFILFSMLALALLCGVTSCKEVKPEFKFKLDLVGEVSDSATCINGDFDISVCNDSVHNFYLVPNEVIKSIECNEGEEANEWLDAYIEENVIAELGNSPSTKYCIHVKGYVKETVSGTMFAVDKIIANTDTIDRYE